MKKISGLIFFLATFNVSMTHAMPFGVSDSRSLAMGGVGIATATSLNASFFNPAMLAQYEVRKELGNNSRFAFPAFTARYSKTIEDVISFKNDDLNGQVSTAITNFNASVTAGNVAEAQTRAVPVVNTSQQLQAGLDEITRGPFAADGNIGLVLGIGGNGEGGALMINARVVGDGVIVETPEDRLLMQKYIATMAYFANNGTIVGAPYPELFDTTGQLIDQTGNLTSTARGTLIAVTEFGMSFAHNVELFHQQFAIGFTPKTARVTTYDIEINPTQQSLTDSQEMVNDWNLNLDLGIDKQINSHWRAGAAVKNVIPQRYDTALNQEVKLNPQWRAGVAYSQRWGVIAADLDVVPNDAIGAGNEYQDIAFGGEWRMTRLLHLLAGYQYNLKATGDHKTGLFSGGFVLQSRLLHFSLTYAESSAEKAYAATLAYRF